MKEQPIILLVDDAPENIDILGGLLSEYQRIVAINGKKAIELAVRDPKPDLILLDIVMPGIDGFEVCRQLKKNDKTSEIPIIFLTSKAKRENILEGFRLGAQDYVTKPFEPEVLLARVKTQLEIAESRNKQKKINHWLENKVNERTFELQQAYKKLEASKKELEEFDSSKCEFLKIISHEIRTPLNGIINSLNIIHNIGVSEEMFEFMDILDESVKRLEKFSYAALGISGLKTDSESVLNKRAHYFSEIIDANLSILEKTIQKKNIDIHVSEIDSEKEVFGDPQYLSRAVYEILDNALKFSPQNDSISIDCDYNNSDLFVTIKDRGKGFTPKLLNRLSLLSSGEHIDQNPGLGLYLAFLIVEKHGGELRYGNRSKKGAWVQLRLPQYN